MMESIPDGPWFDHVPDIEQVEYEAVCETAAFDESLDSRIDHPSSHRGQGDVWFLLDDKGFAGVWEPPNWNGRLRIAPVFVREEYRGQGIGRALVVRRFRYGLDRPDIDSMDTYAHNPEFFYLIGFDWVRHYEDKGTHYLVYEKD